MLTLDLEEGFFFSLYWLKFIFKKRIFLVSFFLPDTSWASLINDEHVWSIIDAMDIFRNWILIFQIWGFFWDSNFYAKSLIKVGELSIYFYSCKMKYDRIPANWNLLDPVSSNKQSSLINWNTFWTVKSLLQALDATNWKMNPFTALYSLVKKHEIF